MDEPDISIFENKTGLAEDMKFLASMPELCDVTFLVGETREPVCAVKVRSWQCAQFISRFADYQDNKKTHYFTGSGCPGGQVTSIPETALPGAVTSTQEGSATA